MRILLCLRVLGILLMIFSLSMLPPLGVAMWYNDGPISPYIVGFLISFIIGAVMWGSLRGLREELKTRDGFFVVALFWTALSTVAAIPFVINFYPSLSFTDAMFEAVSGVTTTGATIFFHLDAMSHGILYYRQQLTFLGGVGVVVIAVAVLPMLGIGGMQLYRAEIAGPVKNTKLKPRMTQTAQALWSIHIGLVLCCAIAYWLAGMNLFEAIGESFSTISTGGFAIHDSGYSYYNSDTINIIAVIFMVLGAINFTLHFQFLKKRSLKVYFQDTETCAYIFMLIIIVIFISALLILHWNYPARSIIDVLFTVTSVSTTTGFSTIDLDSWPSFLPYFMMFIALLGGCAGSTSGGIKMIRGLLVKEQAKRELKRLIHPEAIIALKIGKQTVADSLMQPVFAFVAVFSILFIVLLLLLLADGLDPRTAFGALACCISNTGTAIGTVHVVFTHIPSFSKWILIFAMLAGRLEIFTFLVILTPEYWKK